MKEIPEECPECGGLVDIGILWLEDDKPTRVRVSCAVCGAAYTLSLKPVVGGYDWEYDDLPHKPSLYQEAMLALRDEIAEHGISMAERVVQYL